MSESSTFIVYVCVWVWVYVPACVLCSVGADVSDTGNVGVDVSGVGVLGVSVWFSYGCCCLFRCCRRWFCLSVVVVDGAMGCCLLLCLCYCCCNHCHATPRCCCRECRRGCCCFGCSAVVFVRAPSEAVVVLSRLSPSSQCSRILTWLSEWLLFCLCCRW